MGMRINFTIMEDVYNRRFNLMLQINSVLQYIRDYSPSLLVNDALFRELFQASLY